MDHVIEPESAEQAPLPTASAPLWGWREVGLTLLMLFGGSAAIIIAVRFAGRLVGTSDATALVSPAVYSAVTGIYLMLVLGIYLFAARRFGWAALGVRGTHWINFALVPLFFVVGLSALVSINLLIAQLTGSFENPQAAAISGGQAMSAPAFVAALVLIAGLVPFAEELFFRGMLYPLLRQRSGAPVAIGLNAALFALAHFIPLLFPALFVLGLGLAYLRERSGSIWPGVLYHVMQNALALTLINVALALGEV